jgi:Mg/Co/Ni transporter MgtE
MENSKLDDALVNDLLANESLERIASIIEKAPTNDQSGILNVLEEEKAKSVIELLTICISFIKLLLII